MSEVHRVVAGTLCLLALAGCGGGGSGDAGTAPVQPPVQPPAQPPVLQPNQAWLTIVPAAPLLATATGESRSFILTATASKTIADTVNAAIVDPQGVVLPDARVFASSDTEYWAVLRTAPTLPAGEHSTNLELRLCYDEPTVCRRPVDGSPWKIPLRVSVKEVVDSRGTLSPLAGVANWHTLQGNAAHNGYVAARFDAGKFSRRWVTAGATEIEGTLSLAQDNGRLFALRGGSKSSNSVLTAFSEDSGKPLWKYDLGALYHVNPPAAAGGKVYVTSTGHADGALWVFDQATGTLLHKRGLASQWATYGPPTLYGDALYTSDGQYGGLGKYSTTTYASQWLGQAGASDDWTPAVDGTHAYVYMYRRLLALRTDDGSRDYEIVNTDLSNYADNAAVPALAGHDAYVIQGDRLMAFDLVDRSKKWTVANAAFGQPVHANGVVYAHVKDGGTIEARSAANGTLLWQSEPFSQYAGDGLSSGLIVTDNLIFVSKLYETVAIDIASRRVVWRYPSGGALALSNQGVLYIVSENNAVVAINLR